MKQEKHGFIYEPLVPEDAVFGSQNNLSARGFKGVQLVPDGNWEPYLHDLIYTHQAPTYETNACASHGLANCIELLKRRVHGVSDDESDRFIAKGSGTDPAKGNTPKAVADFVRHNWAATETEWPAIAASTIEEYYAEIPAHIRAKAKERGKAYSFGYERVNPDIASLKAALTLSPVGISCALWQKEDGTYYKPEGWRDGHWVTLLRIRDDGMFVLLDSYEPFIKIAHPFAPEMAMRYALDYEKYSYLMRAIPILTWIRDWWIAWRKKNPPPPSKPPEEPPKPSTETNPYLLWDTPARARHSIRVLCDEAGLTLHQKNVVTACIQQESGFDNRAVGQNRDKHGRLLSTDWGICQINDYYHVGLGKRWKSVKEIVDNPEKAVRWMIQMYKEGKLNLWVSYSSGAYKKFMPK